MTTFETRPKLFLIAAHDAQLAIGRNNQLPWHLSADLKYFKAQTSKQAVLMGRKTFQSIGRALPLRKNLVLTRDPAFRAEGVEVFHQFEHAIGSSIDPIWVIGGSEIYQLALPQADALYLTEVDTSVANADAFFPPYHDQFERIERGDWQRPDIAQPRFRFTVWKRTK